MFVYIITIASTFLSFMALLSCLRFLFSRQGIFWVVPLFISAILLYQNINSLLYFGEDPSVVEVTFSSILPTLLSLFWYALVIIFHYTLKLAIPENRYVNDSRKNLSEAQYLEKYEIRKNKKARLDRNDNASKKNRKPNLPSMQGKLVD